MKKEKDILTKLTAISKAMDKIGEAMEYEDQIYKSELADRLAKGIKGDAAVQHYNEWMAAAGLDHLIIKQK